MGLLQKAARSEAVEQELGNLTTERKKLVTQVSRYARDAGFRRNVLDAYENRCAVTRTQLKLVEAAHILPVASEGSSDHVSNGIGLSPTMHRAYDAGLIFLDEAYCMRLNKSKAKELQKQNLDGELNRLCSFLDQSIHLPKQKTQHPDPEFIRRANQYRRIPHYC